MMKKVLALCLVFTVIVSVFVSAQVQYGNLDGRNYNPKIDPNIDMFISHWKESMPHHTFGSLIERDIFTKCEGDPLRPVVRGAVLTDVKRFSHATLQAGASTTPSTLKDEQIIFYIDGGKGTITAGGKTAELYNGIGVLMPPGIKFTMTNTGDEPLTMYLITESIPEGFKPNKVMKVSDENVTPFQTSSVHWCHIHKKLFTKDDGLATLIGMGPVWFDPMTMGQPHSHGEGVEEIWFSLEGDISIFLGKQVRAFPPGAAYKIPPNGNTPHSTINISDEPVKVFWFMKVPEKSTGGITKGPDYTQLDPKPYDPATEPNIDMYFGSWKESMPRHTHGSLIERDILTKGDPAKPTTRGGVLRFANRFTYATLEARASTTPTTLKGEQEIFYILSGKGTITAGKKTAKLYSGIAVLMPAELAFTMKNTGDESLTMYLVSEPYPEGFRLNKDMLVVDENTSPITSSDAHWIGIVKPLFGTKDGLGTLESILVCSYDPMTFFHPHSHVEGTEEVWTAMGDDIHVLLGKQIRLQPPGTAYMIPNDGKTPHANFNLFDKTIKMFYFARYKDHEVRK